MEPQPLHQYPHEAAYHGLAANIIGGLFLLMVLPALQLAFWLESTSYTHFSASDKQWAAYGGHVGGSIAVIICLIGALVGIRGCDAARRTGEPRVLCATGIVLSLFAAALWILCILAWHQSAGRFM